MFVMALDLNFQNSHAVRLRERETSDPISLFPGLSAHRLAFNLESEVRAGAKPETYPVAGLAGEAHVVNHQNLDRWLGPLTATSLILRPVDHANVVGDLGVVLDDAAVLALDDFVDGQDFTVRLHLRATLTAAAPGVWPQTEGDLTLRISAGLWQRHIKSLNRTVFFVGVIPIASVTGPLADVGRVLREASDQLLAGQWIDAVRLTRLALEAMRKSGLVPATSKAPLDERTLEQKYANATWAVFELASVPQHNGVAQQQPLGRADAYSLFWMTAALYYQLIDRVQPH